MNSSLCTIAGCLSASLPQTMLRAQSDGISQTNTDIQSQIAQVVNKLHETYSIGHRASREELSWIAIGGQIDPATDEPGVSARTVAAAYRFLLALSCEFPSPAVSVDGDGQISFDWIRNAGHVVSVSVDESGMMYWAGLLGSDEFAGKAAIDTDIPLELREMLHKFVG